jgi:DNA-binding CsgD family transcriptional regulator
VALPQQDLKQPIRLAVAVADPALRARIVARCRDLDGIIAEDAEIPEEADIVIADRPPATARPVIALALNGLDDPWPGDLRAVVPPDLDAATLGAVVAVVAAGLTVMPRDTAGAWAENADADLLGEGAAGEPPAALTPREREVLALLAEGASNKAIARALGLSIHTAKFHVASLTEKLGASGRLEAVAIAIRSGLVMV